MNKDFVILGDATCDLGETIREKYNIEYIHSHIVYPDGKDRIATLEWSDYKYFGENCTEEIFYNKLKQNPDGFKTSPANICEISQIFEQFVSKNKDIIYISVSSGMSGAYNFSLKAREIVLKKHPEAKIACINSLKFCSGLGLMLVHAAILRNEGKTFEQVTEYLEQNKDRYHQMGWLEDLSLVEKKGRISPTKIISRHNEGVKVLGEFDHNGFTTPIGCITGEMTAFNAILEYIEKTIENPGEQIIFISESKCGANAEIYKELLQKRLHPKEIIINPIYPPSGINVGPGLLSAYYVGKPLSEGLIKEKELMKSILNKNNSHKAIRKIDGTLFEQMIHSSLNNLRFSEEQINKINVFPVYDGDTGTNMRLTLENGIISISSSNNLGQYLKNLSMAMLLGARGNSGVILSQFFKGLYIYLKDKKKASVQEFANALYHGSKAAYQSVVKPVEGTILTVAREGTFCVLRDLTPDTDLETFLQTYLCSLNKVLKNTSNYLPELQEHQVVDSGGLGYVKIIEGMKNYLMKENSNCMDYDCSDKNKNIIALSNFAAFTKDSPFTLGYCMEFILQILESKCNPKNIQIQEIIKKLNSMGDYLIAAQEGSIIKIHIHVKNPVPVISYILVFGEFVSFKLENMQLQHNQMIKEQ